MPTRSRCCETTVVVLGLLTATCWADPAENPAESQEKPRVAPAEAPAEADKPDAADVPEAAQGGPRQPIRRTANKPVPANPLTDLIKKLFRSPEGQPADQMEQKSPADADSDGHEKRPPRDYIDSRAPDDKARSKLLRQAEALIRESNWTRAVEALQLLLDQPNEGPVRLADGRLVSPRWEANRILAELPAEWLDQYEIQYGGTARQLLNDGRQQADVGKLIEAASRFFHTEAGRDAANQLGTLHFDRGEFGMAALWFARLLEARAPIVSDAAWRMKALVAFRQAGSASQGNHLADSFGSTEHPDRVKLGGLAIDPARWLAELAPLTPPGPPTLAEWPVLYGSPGRTGVVAAGEPLLLPRWSYPSTFSAPVREQMEMLMQDLKDLERATVPSLFPLMVDGKIVCRTMRGVQVVEARTGMPLWETPEGISPERQLNGDPPPSADQLRGVKAPALQRRPRMMMPSYVDFGGDQHPLAGLLFRDGIYGIVSSDGEQLFVIEDHAVLARQQPGSDQETNDPYRRSWSSNRITAYDLASGRPIWDVGGRRMNEPFDARLAGTYFFGTPVADGDELYTVGEGGDNGSEIRLFALDRLTGEPRWSQLIANSDARIEQDFGRRWWTSQVSLADGVVVCPTTVGWLVAVDQLSHTVMWAYRYSLPGSQADAGAGRQSFVGATSLNEDWCPSAPVIVGNRVIYTPSEEKVVVCVDLFTGAELWRKPKEEFLYLAGGFTDRVVLVGMHSVVALSIEDGEARWRLPIPLDAGSPCGFGVATDERYFLPLQARELWAIDLADGKLISKSFLPADADPLGNLAIYRGMLISQSPFGVAAFALRDALETEIQQLKKGGPDASRGWLLEAEMQLAGRSYDLALASLREVKPDELQGELRYRYRSAMIDSLAAVVRSDYSRHDDELRQLEELAETPAERFDSRRLRAEQHLARNDLAAAFEQFWQMADENAEQLIARGDAPDIRVPVLRWVAGHLADIWKQLPEQARAALDERIAAAAGKSADASVSDQTRFLTLFAFHPAAATVEARLIETFAQQGRLVEAERLLTPAMRGADAQTAARATERFARLLLDAGQKRGAAHYYALLEERFSDVELEPGRTAGQLVAELKQAGRLDEPPGPRTPSWADAEFKVERIGSNYSSSMVQPLEFDTGDLPLYRDFRFEVNLQQQRLAMIDASDESLRWLLPLRGSDRSMQGDRIVAASRGHLLYVLHRDVLNALSPAEQKLLWSHPLENPGAAGGFNRISSDFSLPPVHSGSGLLAESGLSRQAATQGMLAVANAEYACVYGRRQCTVLDATSGEVRFILENVPQQSTIYGNEHVLVCVPPDRDQAVAYRSLDGKPLAIENIGELVSNAIRFTHAGLVLVEVELRGDAPGLSRTDVVIRLFDPLTGEDRWRVAFSSSANLSLLDDGHLFVLTPSREIQLLDLETGRVKAFADPLPERIFSSGIQLYAVADADHLFLIANRRSRGRHFFSDALPAIDVNGYVAAFDRHAGKQLWVKEVRRQKLVRTRLADAPVLLFAAREYQRDGAISYSLLNLLVLDKHTGKSLLESAAPSNSGFRSVGYSLADRAIELHSYSDRLRLIAVDKQAAIEQPATP